jgi:UDP-N-acetylglucosamine transferase subunit ALG13
MIFVSVGTQFPFDRLIKIVDDWAVDRAYPDVIGQIGPSDFNPRSIKTHPFLDALRFKELQQEAAVLISHAGMGTILGALELGKPLIIMPRLAKFAEHRNDHQLATMRRFMGKAGIYVAEDAETMFDLLDRHKELSGNDSGISATASPQLINTLKEFISL